MLYYDYNLIKIGSNYNTAFWSVSGSNGDTMEQFNVDLLYLHRKIMSDLSLYNDRDYDSDFISAEKIVEKSTV